VSDSNISSSSPAGVSPVRVAARRPGSRLAARSGNGPGRSPASRALQGGATERSVASSEACRVVIAARPLRVGGRGSRVASFTAKATEGVKSLECSPEELPGVEGAERSDGGGGNWGGPPRPGDAAERSSERPVL